MKSGYRLALSLRSQACPLSSDNTQWRGWWYDIWKLNVLSKVKVFLWRLSYNRLPTKDNFLRRGMDISNLCVFCQASSEDCLHVFWTCPFVKYMWHCSKFESLYQSLYALNFDSILWAVKEKLALLDFELVVVFWWAV